MGSRASAEVKRPEGRRPKPRPMNTINPPARGSEKAVEPKLSQEPPPSRSWNSPSGLWHRKTTIIAALSIVTILLHLVLRFGFHATLGTYQIPLLATLALGGLPLLYDLLRKLLRRKFGSDLLGGISIITSSCWANTWQARLSS
jgi:hypothetical protein